MNNLKYDANGTLRELWDDVSSKYTSWDDAGVPDTRDYTPGEKADAAVRVAQDARHQQVAKWLSDLAAGVPAIQTAKDAALADQATADTLKAQAVTLSGLIGTDITAWQAATPAATVAFITAIRDALVKTAQRQQQIVQALADMYAYRKAVDQNAVTTDNALLWVASYVAEDLN